MSVVAPRPRLPRCALPAVAVGAALLVSGCSADRLSERTSYRADTVTVTAPAPPPPAVTTPAPASPPAAPAKSAAPAHAAAAIPAPATTTPAPAPAPPAPAPRAPAAHHAPRHRQAPGTTTTSDSASAPAAVPSADAAARAAVLAFHRLLDERDPGACDLLTAAYARASFGGDTDAAFAQCRATAQAITVPVRARITGSGPEPGGRTVDVVSHVGTVVRRQTMHLVLEGGEWLINSAEPDGG